MSHKKRKSIKTFQFAILRIFLFSFLFSYFFSYGEKSTYGNENSFIRKISSQNKSYIESLPKEVSSNEVLKIKPIENYEFNLEAENRCKKAKSKVTKELMQCQFSKKGKHLIETYVCDQKKTICYYEEHTVFVRSDKKGFLERLKNLF